MPELHNMYYIVMLQWWKSVLEQKFLVTFFIYNFSMEHNIMAHVQYITNKNTNSIFILSLPRIDNDYLVTSYNKSHNHNDMMSTDTLYILKQWVCIPALCLYIICIILVLPRNFSICRCLLHVYKLKKYCVMHAKKG